MFWNFDGCSFARTERHLFFFVSDTVAQSAEEELLCRLILMFNYLILGSCVLTMLK